MKPTFIAVAIAGALALGSYGLYAQEGMKGGHAFGHGGGFGLAHLTNKLDLTADQQAKVQPILDAAKPQIQAIHQEAMQKSRAVMENAAAQIRPILNADQQTKFDAIQKAHQDMMNAMRAMHEASSK